MYAPSAPQQELIDLDGSRYVYACPGAGKTETIVRRYLRRAAEEQRKGVALLSFTNAAVQEAQGRCGVERRLLQAPHFVGTIDSFINRFLVAPVFRSRHGVVPVFKDSWEQVHGATFRANGVKNDLKLEWIAFDVDGNATFDPTKLGKPESNFFKSITKEQRTTIERRAAGIRRQFMNAGMVDCQSSRLLMESYLTESDLRSTLSALVSARFAEVVVDEIQDCDSHDLALIEFLADAGVRLVLVGDPDQAIFGFRGSSNELVQKSLSRFASGTRLDSNYRSSPAICYLANSLRDGNEKDVATGESRDEMRPILLLSIPNHKRAHDSIKRVAESEGFSSDDIIVLSRNESHARAAAGDLPTTASGNKLVRIAQCIVDIRDPASASYRRVRGLQRLTSLLRTCTESDFDKVLDSEFWEATGLSERELRTGCMRLAFANDPYAMTPKAFRTAFTATVAELGWDWLRGSSLTSPNGGRWPDVGSDVDALRWSTIHGYKGLQAPVAALALVKPQSGTHAGLAQWQQQEAGEERRVLYVGATRAQRLTILVVEETLVETVELCLKRDKVPYEVRS